MKILCIDSKNYTYITKNKEYEMLWEDSKTVKIKDDRGIINYYNKKCFQPIIEDHLDPTGLHGKEGKSNISHPTHYNKGIETIKYITSWEMDFLEGNIIKYVTRYKDKNGVEDLKKAKQYLEWLIEREEKK